QLLRRVALPRQDPPPVAVLVMASDGVMDAGITVGIDTVIRARAATGTTAVAKAGIGMTVARAPTGVVTLIAMAAGVMIVVTAGARVMIARAVAAVMDVR